MSIIATFPDGLDHVTVNGLHQWDWGQKLEIRDATLPALVEVHFACPGMTDAVVRSCAVVKGVATAAIPDRCIEQSAPITAWVVAIGETSGETIRTITLPVIARTRPEPSATIPAEVSDKYTEAVAAMNAAVDAIEDGTITAAEAGHAAEADHATDAGSANSATTADVAASTDFTNATWTAVTDLNNIVVEVGKTYQIRFKWYGIRSVLFTVFDLNPRTEALIGFTYDPYEVASMHRSYISYANNSEHLSLRIDVSGTVSAPVYKFTGIQWKVGGELSDMTNFENVATDVYIREIK
mgnify:CR=1 FL=1